MKMNRFSVTLSSCKDGVGGSYDGVLISVDGCDFREVIRGHEEPFAQKEGHPEIAGNYSLLDASYTTPEVFLGTAEREYGIDEDKVALMGCSCGVVSCWPLTCRIEILEETVIWSDFEQLYRSPDSTVGYWDLSNLGPFVFDLSEYLDELSPLNNNG